MSGSEDDQIEVSTPKPALSMTAIHTSSKSRAEAEENHIDVTTTKPSTDKEAKMSGSEDSPADAHTPKSKPKSPSSPPSSGSKGKRKVSTTSTSSAPASEEVPTMHAVRISSSGFRQRWNGQQWRRLCDNAECPREAQRLSRCAKHQPIKEWRPARRSRAALAKMKAAMAAAASAGGGLDGKSALPHHPCDYPTHMSLLAGSPHRHPQRHHHGSMPLSDPILFPPESASLNMAASGGVGDGAAGGEQEDGNMPGHMQWWPPSSSVPGYTTVPYSSAAAAAYAHHHHAAHPHQHQAYPYENLAMMYGGLPSGHEQLVHAWPMHQPSFSHLP